MMIKDLEVSKELSGKELSAVRGGAGLNFGVQGGVFASQGPGLIFGSPQTIVNVPTQVQTNTEVEINLANILGSIAAVQQV
jgi:hypothetical protein